VTLSERLARFVAGTTAEVRILLRDGSEHALRVDSPRGGPSRPLSWDELVAKFRDCTEAVLSPETAGLVVGLIARLEELPDVNGLTETLTGAATEARA
jgi:2-methylcitrate dehydratase PrpD